MAVVSVPAPAIVVVVVVVAEEMEVPRNANRMVRRRHAEDARGCGEKHKPMLIMCNLEA